LEINVLSQTSALTAGAELWIIPDSEQSNWARQIDWYLNFQIARAISFEQHPPSKELLALTTHFEVAMPTIKVTKGAPTLIHSSNFLPNLNTLILPFQNNEKEWLQNSFEVWDNLKHPILRIFCPPHVQQDQIRAKFEKLAGKAMTVVFDSIDKSTN
jgi:hypothetical protein